MVSKISKLVSQRSTHLWGNRQFLIILLGVLCLGLLLAWPNFVPRPDYVTTTNITSIEGALLAANYAKRQNNLDAEVYYYTHANRLTPNDPSILSALFEATLALGEMDKAQLMADKLVKFQPHHSFARLLLASDALKNNKGALAMTHASMILADDIANIAAKMVMLWGGAQMGDAHSYRQALVKLENETTFAEVSLRNLALFYEYSGNLVKADEVYRAVIQAHGLVTIDHVLDYLFFLHRTHKEQERNFFFKNISDQNRRHAVYRHIKPLLAKPPAPFELKPAQGLALGLEGIVSFTQFMQAPRDKLLYARIASWIAPSSRRAVMSVAEALAEIERYDDAILLYQKISQAPYFGETIRATIALLYEVTQATDKGIALLEAEIHDHAGHFSIKILADMLRRKEDFKQAEAYYTSLIDRLGVVEKQDWELFYGRGIARERLGKWQQAEADLLVAKEFSGNRPHVLNYLGYSWIDNGKNIEQGLALVEQAVQAEPKNGYFMDSLGWAFYRLGAFEKAVKLLEHATMLQPGDPEIIDHLGDALWQVGRYFEARYQWRRVLTLDIKEQKKQQIERKIERGVFEHHQGQKLAI